MQKFINIFENDCKKIILPPLYSLIFEYYTQETYKKYTSKYMNKSCSKVVEWIDFHNKYTRNDENLQHIELVEQIKIIDCLKSTLQKVVENMFTKNSLKINQIIHILQNAKNIVSTSTPLGIRIWNNLFISEFNYLFGFSWLL